MRITAPFCRVVVLTPGARVDVALPSDVPVAELVAMLHERLAGTRNGLPGPSAGRPRVWRLTGMSGVELPMDATLAGLGVLDGDLLRLAPRFAPPHPPIFDDPVDAVAHPEQLGLDRPAEWDSAAWRRFACWVAAVAVLGAAASLAASRGPSPVPSPAAALAGSAAAAAIAAAVWADRRELRIAPGIGAGSLPLAAAAAWAGLPGVPDLGHLLGACVATGGVAAVLLGTLRAAVGPLVGTISAAALGGLGLLAALVVPVPAGTGVGGIGAATAALALALLSAVPRAAARLAGLPTPVVPGNAAELAAAERQRGGELPDELAARCWLARRYLAGLTGGAATVAAVGAVLAGSAGGVAGLLFAAVTVVVLLLRTRSYVDRSTVRALVCGALGAVGGLALVGLVASSDSGRLLIGLGLLAVAGVTASLAGMAPAPEPSPVLRRGLDVLGSVLTAAAFPLALAVLDVYRAVGQL